MTKRAVWAALALVIGCVAILVVGSLTGGLKLPGRLSGPVADPAGAARPSEKELLATASRLVAEGDLAGGQKAYRMFIDEYPSSRDVARALEELERVNMELILSPAATEDSASYIVAKGDTLSGIAKRNRTTVALLRAANRIEADRIRVGQRLKVQRGRFSVAADLSQNILTLKNDANIVKTYRIVSGGVSPSDAGTYSIASKSEDAGGGPARARSGRVLRLSAKGLAICAESASPAAGAGRIVLTDRDTEELFTVLPEGAEVVIAE